MENCNFFVKKYARNEKVVAFINAMKFVVNSKIRKIQAEYIYVYYNVEKY